MYIDKTVLDKLFSGNTGVYKRVVGLFTGKIDRNMADFRRLIGEGDAERFTIEIHGLKGAAANLGAMPLSDLAKQMEQMGKSGDLEGIKGLISELEELYRHTVDEMNDFTADM